MEAYDAVWPQEGYGKGEVIALVTTVTEMTAALRFGDMDGFLRARGLGRLLEPIGRVRVHRRMASVCQAWMP